MRTLATLQAFAQADGIDADWIAEHYRAGDLQTAALWQAPYEYYTLAASTTVLAAEVASDPPARNALSALTLLLTSTQSELQAMGIAQRADLNALLRTHRVSQKAQQLFTTQRATLSTSHALHYTSLIREVIDLAPRGLLWGLSNDFNTSGVPLRASAAKIELPLGYPLRGFHRSLGHPTRQFDVVRERMRGFDEPLLAEVRRLEHGTHGVAVDVAWDLCSKQRCDWQAWLAKLTLKHDLYYAGFALFLAFVCICVHTRSLLLGVLGALQIGLSFPLALFVCVHPPPRDTLCLPRHITQWLAIGTLALLLHHSMPLTYVPACLRRYRYVLGITLFGVLHVIGIFVILGIGCDDLFVMSDAWAQSAWLAPPAVLESLDTRLWWAYRRAGKAMLVTTLTDVGAFLSSLLAVVPNLVSFAIFTSLLATANLALVLTLWPCALLLHDRCCARCGPCARGRQTVGEPRMTRTMSSTSDARSDGLHSSASSDGPSVVASPDLATVADVSLAEGMPSADLPPPISQQSSVAGSVAGSVASSAIGSVPGSPIKRAGARPRLVELWYSDHYVPWLRRGRTGAWLVCIFGLAAAALSPFVLQLEGPSYDLMVWPSWHDAYRYLTLRDRHFSIDHPRLQVLWGTLGVDRSSCDPWNDQDLGVVIWDDDFDLADPHAQAALLNACTAPLTEPTLMVRGADGGWSDSDDHMCVIRALAGWAAERNRTFPFPRNEFNPALLDFLSTQPQWLASLSFAPTSSANGGGDSWRVRHVAVSFTLSVEPHAPASRRRRVYDRWEELLADLNAAAPPTAKHATQSATALWILMALQELMVTYAFGVVLCSVLVGFCFVLLSTRSLTLATLCTITISATVAAWAGVLLACGAFDQGLGVVESLVLMVSVGLMLDPITHIAFAYSEAHGTREERLASSLSVIGISVLAGCVSTAGACSIMALATIVLFSRFAVLFCSLMAVTLLYANVFLAPLLLLFGPVGKPQTEGDGPHSSWRRRWGRPRSSMSASDSAAQGTSPSSVASHDEMREVELNEQMPSR